jgi:putative membrane protein
MLAAIIGYAIHVIAAAIMLGVFIVIYMKITPFDEMALIHAGKGAAALSLGGAVVGFSLTLGSAIVYNAGLFGVIGWAVVAMIVQVIVYAIASRLMHTIKTEIEAGNAAMGGFMGALSLAAGIINAACLS